MKIIKNVLESIKGDKGFPDGSMGKESTCNTGDVDSIPGSGFNPWRKWQSTPVFLSEKSHGQSLVGYSPKGHKESDMTEAT